jgi:hypothetical protein
MGHLYHSYVSLPEGILILFLLLPVSHLRLLIFATSTYRIIASWGGRGLGRLVMWCCVQSYWASFKLMRRSRQESARWGLQLWFIEVFLCVKKKIALSLPENWIRATQHPSFSEGHLRMLRLSDFNMEYGELQIWVWVKTMPRKRTQIGNHSETSKT